MSRLALLADIGGTNTRVGLSTDGQLRLDSIRRFRNADHTGLDHVLESYRSVQEVPDLAGICVDIAGPVRKGAGRLTNLDWALAEDLLRDWSGAPFAALINDLTAQGHGVVDAPASSLRQIVRGAEHPEGTSRLIVNVGTGFNAVAVHDSPGGVIVPSAEAGHGALPVQSDEDLRLCRMIEADHGFAAVEDVLSGRGLERCYRWVTSEDGAETRMPAHQILAELDANPNGPAARAVRVFVRILGKVTGDLALNHLPFGGIYLVGGVATALAPRLAELGFVEALQAKGRFSDLVSQFAVHAVEDDYAALRGAAHYLNEVFENS